MASDERGTDFSIQDHYGNYRGSQVNIRLHLVFPISPLILVGFWTNLILTESHSPGESSAVRYKKFGAELAEDVGYYRNCSTRTYLRILAPSLLGNSDLILDLERRQSSLSSKTFLEVFGMVLG